MPPSLTPVASFAVFPFLKTSHPIDLGGFTFRSTDDVSTLHADEGARVRELSEMLFVQDHYRVRSGSYVSLPHIDLNPSPPILDDLARIQAVVAYIYSSPHPTSGDPFLTIENASLVIFSPDRLSPSLLKTDHHADLVGDDICPTPEASRYVQGYHGLYNFRHHFWAVKGTRIFGPTPRVTLNISQDLYFDVSQRLRGRPEYDLVTRLLARPESEVSERVLTAITWYNRANSSAATEEVALVHLAIAFEALLGLPSGKGVTDRFRDAINLLLGKVPRLDAWLDQFYRARSQIVHEGRTENLRFTVAGAKAGRDETQVYHSLLSYGRKVFQLCVGTSLTGAQLAHDAKLAEKLVSNQERFERICTILADESVPEADRVRQSAEDIRATERYRFVPESGLRVETLIGCAKRAAVCLLATAPADLEEVVKGRLSDLATAKRSVDHYDELEALEALHAVLDDPQRSQGSDDPRVAVALLIEVVHGYTFMHYYWLKDQRAEKGGVAEENGRR